MHIYQPWGLDTWQLRVFRISIHDDDVNEMCAVFDVNEQQYDAQQ